MVEVSLELIANLKINNKLFFVAYSPISAPDRRLPRGMPSAVPGVDIVPTPLHNYIIF